MLRANLDSISLGRKSHCNNEYLFCLTGKVQHSSDQYNGGMMVNVMESGLQNNQMKLRNRTRNNQRLGSAG